MTAPSGPLCVDCIKEGITTYRKPVVRRGQTVPGSRCATHYRARRMVTNESAWATRMLKLYGITTDEYWQLYAAQDGCCYICRRATGKAKRLAVDHDHKTGYVRGLLCTTCNKRILGHLRDDPEALIRAAYYLIRPPAFDQIGKRFAPVERGRDAFLPGDSPVLP